MNIAVRKHDGKPFAGFCLGGISYYLSAGIKYRSIATGQHRKRTQGMQLCGIFLKICSFRRENGPHPVEKRTLLHSERKTLIVGMDIRKPALNRLFSLSRKSAGITQYLASPVSTDLLALCQPVSISPYLYVLPGGAIPPNPTELVARKSLDEAFALLRQHFDYIILDSAPIGIVTDTRLIARVADICVYVCRADFTHKNDYALINDLKQDKKLPTLCTLINGIDMDKRKNGYYYGYGKYGKYGKYGYGKKYGYGYGYGYGKE